MLLCLVHITRGEFINKFKYSPYLLILLLHHLLRYSHARSIETPIGIIVAGFNGINDAFWYTGIAQHGYNFAPGGAHANQSSYVFYPLLPQLIAGVHHLGIPVVRAGLLVVTIVAFLAAIQLSRLVSTIFGNRVGYITGLLFVSQLYALSLVSIMTESLFALLVFSTLLAWQKKQYGLASVFIVLTCLTKSFGIALVIAILISCALKLKKSEASMRELALPIVACVVAPFIWVTFVGIRFSNLFEYFELQTQGWGNKFNAGLRFIQFMLDTTFHSGAATTWEIIVVAVAIVTIVLLIWMLTFDVPIEWKAFVVAAFYLSIAHESWHIADARFFTSIGIILFPVAVFIARSKLWLQIVLISAWIIPSLYVSSFATSGF